MSKIADLLLLEMLHKDKPFPPKKGDDLVSSLKKISKLKKLLKEEEEAKKKDEKVQDKPKTFWQEKHNVALVIFLAIPILSVTNFWLLTTMMFTAIEKLQHLH